MLLLFQSGEGGANARAEIICFVVFNLLSAARLANVVGGNIPHLKLQLYFWTCSKVAHLVGTERPADVCGGGDLCAISVGFVNRPRGFIYLTHALLFF